MYKKHVGGLSEGPASHPTAWSHTHDPGLSPKDKVIRKRSDGYERVMRIEPDITIISTAP